VRGDVLIDDRLFVTQTGWPDSPISPIWVNENLIDVTVRPTAAGRPARVSHRPRTAAYRVVSDVTTGRAGSATALDIDETRAGVIRISGSIAAGGGSTVRTWEVADPAAFARTAFIEALRRAGVRVDARATGSNDAAALPRSRTYPAATRLGVWTSPRFAEYVKVVLKVSYNRGADLLACLTGARVGLRDCDRGLARTARVVAGLGVPPAQAFFFDGAGSDDRNRATPAAMNALMTGAARRPWGASFRAALPQLGVPGGGDLAIFGTTSPARGKLQAKTGTRAGTPPGHWGIFLESRGLAGHLEGASGRALLITLFVNNTPLAGFPDLFDLIDDQVRIVEAIQQGS
jgi:D-alanyl-D-alanine carboxypeptidase/D-alanyl-D-alanine-endopeptidase (penicillin-binding protein 4)